MRFGSRLQVDWRMLVATEELLCPDDPHREARRSSNHFRRNQACGKRSGRLAKSAKPRAQQAIQGHCH